MIFRESLIIFEANEDSVDEGIALLAGDRLFVLVFIIGRTMLYWEGLGVFGGELTLCVWFPVSVN